VNGEIFFAKYKVQLRILKKRANELQFLAPGFFEHFRDLHFFCPQAITQDSSLY